MRAGGAARAPDTLCGGAEWDGLGREGVCVPGDATRGVGSQKSWGLLQVAPPLAFGGIPSSSRALWPSSLPASCPASPEALPVNMASARELWGCEDPSRWAAILAHHDEVVRTRAGPQRQLEALDRW